VVYVLLLGGDKGGERGRGIFLEEDESGGDDGDELGTMASDGC
jgi:hypothetical protein